MRSSLIAIHRRIRRHSKRRCRGFMRSVRLLSSQSSLATRALLCKECRRWRSGRGADGRNAKMRDDNWGGDVASPGGGDLISPANVFGGAVSSNVGGPLAPGHEGRLQLGEAEYP